MANNNMQDKDLKNLSALLDGELSCYKRFFLNKKLDDSKELQHELRGFSKLNDVCCSLNAEGKLSEDFEAKLMKAISETADTYRIPLSDIIRDYFNRYQRQLAYGASFALILALTFIFGLNSGSINQSQLAAKAKSEPFSPPEIAVVEPTPFNPTSHQATASVGVNAEKSTNTTNWPGSRYMRVNFPYEMDNNARALFQEMYQRVNDEQLRIPLYQILERSNSFDKPETITVSERP